jgi:hypothetical protein
VQSEVEALFGERPAGVGADSAALS